MNIHYCVLCVTKLIPKHNTVNMDKTQIKLNHLNIECPHQTNQAHFLHSSYQPTNFIHTHIHNRTYLQLQRQGEALCSSVEAPGSLSQGVESHHLILRAQTCPGHQRAPTQQHMVTAPRKTRMWLERLVKTSTIFSVH